MNAFDLGRSVEELGWAALEPFMQTVAYRGRFVLTSKGALSTMLQAMVGDVLVNTDAERVCAIEIKSEKANDHGNFFLETWSNLKFERRKMGWMFTMHADYLWYYFVRENRLYSIPFRPLWEWAFLKGQIFLYPEKPQGRYEQQNKTFGRCVPIDVVVKQVGCKLFEPPNPTPLAVHKPPPHELLPV